MSGRLRIGTPVGAGLFLCLAIALGGCRKADAGDDPVRLRAPLASGETAIGETCQIPYSGPVSIIPMRSASALARSVAARPSRTLVYETEDTAIFEDGRVFTVDLENVGNHLNAVGWAANPMKILGAGVRPGGSSGNYGWSSAPNTQNKVTQAKKKRRRRG